jgi:putative SOS response-associated peptidase YedK
MASGEPMSVAGIWDTCTRDGKALHSCSIVTTDANNVMGKIHDRMPVILGKDDFNAWLSASKGQELLVPCPDDWIEATEVSSYVNKVANQGAECIGSISN